MICASCATDLAPRATICSTCGRPVEDPLVGATINDRYRIGAKLAVGGFGSIYRATQVSNGRRVAIKVMHRELSADERLVARFRREAVALCSLRDAHTVTTYEFDQMPDGRLFIVMELLEGRTLLELFRASGGLPWRRVLAIARSVCSSLAEAHALGIVHRDLKPANIFLENRPGDGEFVKVLDFGIAKIRQGSDLEDDTELTVAGQPVGTLEYMAPEQLMGGECDGRTDIYALGVVAYEMIVGRRPFASAGAPALLTAQISQKVPKPGLFVPLPGAVSDILLRCLEREEAARYPDASALAAAIDEVLAQPDVELLAARTSTTRGHSAPARAPTPVPVRPSTPVLARPSTPVPARPSTPVPARPSTPVPARPSTPIPARASSRPAVAPPPGASPGRIALIMLALAVLGVLAGVIITRFGI